MLFKETQLKDLFEVSLQRHEDMRGFFARMFCVDEYKKIGIDFQIKQINISSNKEKNTLRGLHYQLPPHGENRVVACISGSAIDISLDLRPNSPTFGQYFRTTLSSENKEMMFIPNGFAHGYLTLEANTEFLYLNTEAYSPEFDRVIRWDDKKFDINWTIAPKVLSPRDANQTDFDPSHHLTGMETINL